jgi:hypothetical protein
MKSKESNIIEDEQIGFLMEVTAVNCLETLIKHKQNIAVFDSEVSGKDAFEFLINDPNLCREFTLSLLMELKRMIFEDPSNEYKNEAIKGFEESIINKN